MLNLIPDSMLQKVEEEIRRNKVPGAPDPYADPVIGNNNPLHVNTEFDYEPNLQFKKKCTEKCCASNKIVTRKFARSHTELVRQEVWPHNGVSRKYVKKTTFDTLEFEQFVAGETRIIYSMLQKKDAARAAGRLRVLVLIAHWFCRSKNWPQIRGLYEGIVDEMELGTVDWTHDFSSYETMVVPASHVNPAVQTSTTAAAKATPNSACKGQTGVFWCKEFQHGRCEQKPPHMAQIKPDEMPVPVLHICASCLQNGRKRKDHAENDPTCPSKK